MKRLLIVISLVFIQCSSYNVRTVVNEGSQISDLKHTGILFRIPYSSMVKMSELKKNMKHWLSGYKRINSLHVINYAEKDVTYYRSELDRFYQLSINSDFLKYKSLGTVYQYLNVNEDALKKSMENSSLDSLIIYEVDGFYSPEMEHIDFNSIVTIVDRDLKILYMDYQKDLFESGEHDAEKVKNILLDKITTRLIEIFFDRDFIEKR